jgi:hypothetical protein
MNWLNKNLKPLLAFAGMIFGAGILWASFKPLPAKVADHEKRLISVENQLPYIAEGVDILLKDRGLRRPVTRRK